MEKRVKGRLNKVFLPNFDDFIIGCSEHNVELRKIIKSMPSTYQKMKKTLFFNLP